nr:DUF2637 domain-containing protein [Streptomyces prunicolor]
MRPLCALVVAGVAACASYIHQRSFALRGGADTVSASLWPLSVDGLLLLSTRGLLKRGIGAGRRAKWAVWAAFLLGIAVSLAANVAAAPRLEWRSVLVAGWPPVALLLSVELLVHQTGGRQLDSTMWWVGRDDAEGDDGERGEDPLLARATVLDLEYRRVHQRPASAETVRRELHVGAKRSRQLVALLRDRLEEGDARRWGHVDRRQHKRDLFAPRPVEPSRGSISSRPSRTGSTRRCRTRRVARRGGRSRDWTRCRTRKFSRSMTDVSHSAGDSRTGTGSVSDRSSMRASSSSRGRTVLPAPGEPVTTSRAGRVSR